VGLFRTGGAFGDRGGHFFYVTGAGFLGPKYRLRTYLPKLLELRMERPVRLDGSGYRQRGPSKMVPPHARHIPEKSRNIELILRGWTSGFNRRF